MKLINANLQPFKNDNGIEIFLDENYVKGWWKSCPDFSYLYVHDKNATQTEARNCITMFKDGDETAYFICEKKYLPCDKHGYFSYDTYLNVLEFGIDDEAIDDFDLLVDYLFEFARYMGVKFIKVSKKESFTNFYSLITPYATANESDCFILNVEKTNLYEDFLHLRLYDDDFLTFEELCFLQCRNFTLTRDNCFLKIGDDVLSVDRKTRKITFPNFVKNDGALPLLLDKENCGLIAFLSTELNLAKTLGLTVGVQIADLSQRFAFLGEQKLLVFNDVTLDENVFEILYKIKTHTTFEKYSFYCVNLVKDSLWQGYSFSHHNLNSDLQNARLCLDLEGFTFYPPSSTMAKNMGFNKRLTTLTEFALAIECKESPYKRVVATITGETASVWTLNAGEEEKRISLSKQDFISVLQNACFCNWKNEYKKPIKNLPYVWAIVLKFGENTQSFRGANDQPKTLKYFLEEFFALLK